MSRVKRYAHDPETYAIIGAAMEVHRELGSGFLESAYHEGLVLEFAERGIPFQHEVALQISYKGQPLKTVYRADFVCFGRVVVEVKAITHLGPIEEAQLLHYLKATGFERGLLLDFGSPSLEVKRLVLSRKQKRPDNSA